MKIRELIQAIKEFDGFRYPWNKYGWSELVYTYWRVPKYKLKLMFKYLKDVDIVSWDCVSCHELLYAQFMMFFEDCHEHLTPWLEDGKWQEHKHSENWEGTPIGEGSGLKYRDMLEVYIYIKYIRHENEKKFNDLQHLLLCDENYRTWWEDTDETYNGEKCVKHNSNRLANFSVKWGYSDNNVDDEEIYNFVKFNMFPRIHHNTFKDNLEIRTEKLSTVSDEYNDDFDALYKIERELVELDNKYATWIIKNREYLWW